MKNYLQFGSIRNVAGNAFAGLFVLCFFAFAVSGQAPPNPIPAQENIPSGALIIPMDNFHQGTNTFNLRAYGLANLMLHNNVPVKWAIKPGKSKDGTDFSANVTRIAGLAGNDGITDSSFSGGPFIVMPEFDTPFIRDLIASFNGAGAAVTVYKTNAAASIDIRYTLTHKPRIAIGPDGGKLGSGVYQLLFSRAGIETYTSVDDDTINENSCFTLATQAHSTSPAFVNGYRNFAVSGGNLLLQCRSIETFENDANGRFQTTLGYSIFGVNAGTNVDTPLLYPDGSMPFNQFIGILADQIGAVTEYSYAPGSGPMNGNRVSVINSGLHSEKFVATVSQLLGNDTGGHVFELGGHDYSRMDTNATELSMLNGQRMALNAAFVPATRPCGSTAAAASIGGTVRDANGNGINKARITITNANSNLTRTVLTNAFGHYNVELEAGDLYVVSVSHKRYRFAAPFVTVTLSDSITDLAFVANPLHLSNSKAN